MGPCIIGVYAALFVVIILFSIAGYEYRSTLKALEEKKGSKEDPVGEERALTTEDMAEREVEPQVEELSAREIREAIETLRTISSDLANQTQKLREIEARVSRLESGASDSNLAIQLCSEKVQNIEDHVQKIEERTKEALEITKSNFSYNLREDFKCESCGSKGLVAIHIRCTRCDEESWWGWWPASKLKAEGR